ncbi:MAG: DUF6776 family protein [Pseudomonadales bacterium]
MAGNIEIRVFRDGRIQALAVCGFVLLVVLMLAVYFFGRSGLSAQIEQLEKNQTAFEDQFDQQLRTIERLEFEVAELNLSESVSELAAADLQEVVISQQSKIARLENEAIYYRNLMSPKAGAREVFVHRIEVVPGQQSDVLNYQILLTHADPDGGKTAGRIGLKLAGLAAEGETLIDVVDAGLVDDSALDYEFRYFQNFKGVLKLPEGFKPSSLQLEVTSLAGKLLEQQEVDVQLGDA